MMMTPWKRWQSSKCPISIGQRIESENPTRRRDAKRKNVVDRSTKMALRSAFPSGYNPGVRTLMRSLMRISHFALVALAVVAGALFTACPPPVVPPPPPEQDCPPNRRTCDSDRVCAGGFCDKENDNADGQPPGDGVATADDNLGCCV